MASLDISQATSLLAILTGLSGVAGVFWGVYQYREGQTLKRKETLFDLIREFDESDRLKPAKVILDEFYLDPQAGWANQNERYYGRENLQHILRDHRREPVRDPGEIAIRNSFDALLDFFGRLSYLHDVGLIKWPEIEYFQYYLGRASRNEAVRSYAKIYEFPLYERLVTKASRKLRSPGTEEASGARATRNPSEDSRLKIIELAGTMSGFIAIIVSLQQSLYPTIIVYLMVMFFVILVLSGIFLYAAILRGMGRNRVRFFALFFSLGFSEIIATILAVAFIHGIAEAVDIASPSYYIPTLAFITFSAIGLFLIFDKILRPQS